MSKRKPVLLGPDGKPYVAPPKPATKTEVSVAGLKVSDEVHTFTFDVSNYLTGGTVYFGEHKTPKAEAKETLASAVGRQVASLTAGFDGAGGEELPKPPADLHTYLDAFASARTNCKHPDPEQSLHGREFFCPDCRRYFGIDEYRRTRDRGLFGGWFGS